MQKEEQVSFLAEKSSGRCRFDRQWFWSFQWAGYNHYHWPYMEECLQDFRSGMD